MPDRGLHDTGRDSTSLLRLSPRDQVQVRVMYALDESEQSFEKNLGDVGVRPRQCKQRRQCCSGGRRMNADVKCRDKDKDGEVRELMTNGQQGRKTDQG